MKVMFVRSPYFIVVDEAGQIESKIELFIWHKNETEPASPTYTLSKKVPSATQTTNSYNISNYVKEYIDIISPSFVSNPTEEEDTNWAYVKVRRYADTGTGFDLLDNETYAALNGYTNYKDGYSAFNSNECIVLKTDCDSYKYDRNSIHYVNVFIDYTDDTDKYEVVYNNLSSTSPTSSTILFGDTETQYLFKIPISDALSNYDNGNTFKITKNSNPLITFTFLPECEPKYTPALCSFINQYGGWEFLTFFKARTESWDVKNKEYQLLPDSIAYNTSRGESKFFNYEARQSIKLNTGWLNEDYKEIIKELLTSETILLDGYPVKLKTMNTDLKTSLQDKMINYQIEFEYNYNQINNVI